MTRAPALMSARAVARPMPREAPVTTAVLPSSGPSDADARGRSAPVVLDIVVLRLPEAEAAQAAGRHVGLEHPPARDDDVLCRGVHATHELDVHVHVPVIHAVDDFVLNNRF